MLHLKPASLGHLSYNQNQSQHTSSQARRSGVAPAPAQLVKKSNNLSPQEKTKKSAHLLPGEEVLVIHSYHQHRLKAVAEVVLGEA